jgi:hypothetical protein
MVSSPTRDGSSAISPSSNRGNADADSSIGSCHTTLTPNCWHHYHSWGHMKEEIFFHTHSHIPRSSFELGLEGEFFSRHVQVCMLMFKFYQIAFICSLSSYIFMSDIWFSCVQVLAPQATQPLQVYVRNYHVIIPSENQLHLPVTPYEIYL